MPSTRNLDAEAASGFADAVICDVDGTLCDVRSIRHFVERPPGVRKFKADFHRFHSESLYSPAHDAVVQFVRRCRATGLTVLIVSGREARWSGLTATWLAKHEVEYDEMFLRPRSDYRPDAVVKAEIRQQITRRFKPRLAIDDRPEIIEVWQAAAIPTSQVTEDGELMPIAWPSGLQRDPNLEALLIGRNLGAK